MLEGGICCSRQPPSASMPCCMTGCRGQRRGRLLHVLAACCRCPRRPPAAPARSHEVQQLFVQEAERLHQLRHPHVVALYGVSLSGPKGYLLME